MATHHFPTIAVSRRQGAISEHFVFGERNSGTNLAHQLLVQNIPALHLKTAQATGLAHRAFAMAGSTAFHRWLRRPQVASPS